MDTAEGRERQQFRNSTLPEVLSVLSHMAFKVRLFITPFIVEIKILRYVYESPFFCPLFLWGNIPTCSNGTKLFFFLLFSRPRFVYR